MKRILTIFTIFSIILMAQDKCANKLTVTPYGYFKLDMSYDSDLISAGNFARWAIPNSGDAIPTTHITANQSRFGIDVVKGDVSGKAEIDFYGFGTAENKSGVLLRKAYAQANFENFSIRAGQDSDVISPLVPSTINYPVAWWAGNIGYRRPMLKLFGDMSGISWTIALARNIGGDLANETDVADGIDDGAAGVLPEIQGRLATTLLKYYTIGFSGHFSQLDRGGEDGKYESWSGNVDLNLSITPNMSLSGEAFVGHNIAAHLGGIANASTFDGIETQGGWINLKYKPNKDFALSAGISMDDPCDCDLEDGMRSKNTMIFANAYQNLIQGLLIGFEISSWTTEYKNMDSANALRGQLAFLYKF